MNSRKSKLLKNLDFVVPNFLGSTNIDFYYEVTDDNGGFTTANQTIFFDDGFFKLRFFRLIESIFRFMKQALI